MKKLYILHGWTYKPEPWLDVIKDLKAQGIDAELLRVPGLGKPSKKSFTIEGYVAWAKENLPKGSIALGHSNGGRILLNDAAGYYEKSAKRDISRGLSKALSPLKKSKFARKLAHKILGASDYENAPENMKVTLTNMLDSDKALDIAKVTTPTQIIWGSDDNITPLRQGKKIHELIKGSELTVKDGWRHSHYLVSTKELADVIAEKFVKLAGGKKC